MEHWNKNQRDEKFIFNDYIWKKALVLNFEFSCRQQKFQFRLFPFVIKRWRSNRLVSVKVPIKTNRWRYSKVSSPRSFPRIFSRQNWSTSHLGSSPGMRRSALGTLASAQDVKNRNSVKWRGGRFYSFVPWALLLNLTWTGKLDQVKVLNTCICEIHV